MSTFECVYEFRNPMIQGLTFIGCTFITIHLDALDTFPNSNSMLEANDIIVYVNYWLIYLHGKYHFNVWWSSGGSGGKEWKEWNMFRRKSTSDYERPAAGMVGVGPTSSSPPHEVWALLTHELSPLFCLKKNKHQKSLTNGRRVRVRESVSLCL